MSEIVYLIADVTGLSKPRAWRKSKVDKKVVGALTKHLGPLQQPITVAEALKLVTTIAGPLGSVTLDERAGTVTIRAVMSDHHQHDIAAPLIGAFRLAGAHGGVGSLWLVDGGDVPTFGHALEVGPSQPSVRALGKKELAAAASLAARAECAELERGAERAANAYAAPATPSAAGPSALEEVDEGERAAYGAAFAMVAAASDEAIGRAIAAEAAWAPPGGRDGTDLDELAELRSKAERLAFLGDAHWAVHAGHLHLCFRLVARLDLARGLEVLTEAREAGVWPGWLAHSMLALFESGDKRAEEEAWAIFEACAQRKDCDLNHWHFRADSAYGIARSAITTADLVARLENELGKRSQRASLQRIFGYCMALAFRSDDALAHRAIARAAQAVPERAREALTTYARRYGWKG